MTFAWTPHRFAGGALALDVANSVVLRFDPARRIDRFAMAEQIDDFPRAAEAFCAERALFGPLKPVREQDRPAFIALREAIDRHFRRKVLGEDARLELADLLEHAAGILRQAPSADDLGLATAHSALRLIAGPETERMKICPNCCWLFLDRSKNKSRAWCDMAVCGNRAKASRHYHRKRQEIAT